jgi:zinc/manganese transport system substrate-binding protein
VVATVNTWGDLAAQLGGDRVEVETLAAGGDPHDYEPAASDARAVALAGLVIVNGTGYDEWASRLVEGSPAEDRSVLDVGELLAVPAGGNPHQWNSAASVERFLDAVTARYTQLRPADAAYFTERADAVDAALEGYRAAITRIRDTYVGTPVGASEELLEPLTETLGLHLVTPEGYLEARHEETEPSVADRLETERQLARREVRAWLFDSREAAPDVLALNALATTHDIPVVEVTETIATPGQSFQDWQLAQLTAVEKALATGGIPR